jgi:hypothetical protein
MHRQIACKACGVRCAQHRGLCRRCENDGVPFPNPPRPPKREPRRADLRPGERPVVVVDGIEYEIVFP